MKKTLSAALALLLVMALISCASTGSTKENLISYNEEVVSVESSKGDHQISAVLTTPVGTEGEYPLVVMLHGFGGYKDEGVGFIYIARTLAEYGIASIRMDFAGTGDDQRDFTEYTLESAAQDADDCLKYALENADVDENKLGIFGYSNGGRIATLITGRDPEKYDVRVLLAPAVIADIEGDTMALEACGELGYIPMEWFGATLKISREYYESTIDFGKHLEEYEKAIMPTLVIRGTEDPFVSQEIVDAYVAATGSDKLMIYGSDHGYGFYSGDEKGFVTLDTVAAATASFFSKNFSDENSATMFSAR